MSSYFDNDDDLFDDSSSSSQSSFYNSFLDSSNSTEDEELDSFLQNTKNYFKSKSPGSDSFIKRTGIVTSLYELINRFVHESDSLSRSIFTALNRLTDGQYAKDLYADVLEESIIKRFAIYDFLRAILSTDNSRSFKLAAEYMNLQLDETFIKIYFGSVFKVMSHSIDRNIDIYQKLCEQINRVPMKAIIDKDYDSFQFNLFSTNSHINQSFESIRDSLGFKTYS